MCIRDSPYSYGNGKYRVSLLDCGLKKSILKSLADNDCTIHVFPAHTTAEELLANSPDGIFLSPGPGDPQDCLLYTSMGWPPFPVSE